MNIKSRKIIGGNGKVREHIINEFNVNGLIKKTVFFEENGDIRYTVFFEYDSNENCISEKQYDSENNFVGSLEWKFDKENRQIEQIERTAENEIWDWNENQYLDENIVVYLAKDKDGIIQHKTVENKNLGVQKRYDSDGNMYAEIIEEFDKNNRIANRKTLDRKGKVTQEDIYEYIDQTEKWTLVVDGKIAKIEERILDKNGNEISYVRRDDKGNSTEYVKWTRDDFGNPIRVENGIELNKPTNISEIKIEYLK
ncbi:hypothetical protein JCM19275_8 [Nonlabens ulvanivorans]|uniref:Uncharacterized protein n=1 Tax=Nonlabens ulvanivorans TaxID=906888 RepID=A0A090X438_NONUL|nr:hypothetical protein JCM19275_8 [Nonlabens ulvanivorans]